LWREKGPARAIGSIEAQGQEPAFVVIAKADGRITVEAISRLGLPVANEQKTTLSPMTEGNESATSCRKLAVNAVCTSTSRSAVCRLSRVVESDGDERPYQAACECEHTTSDFIESVFGLSGGHFREQTSPREDRETHPTSPLYSVSIDDSKDRISDSPEGQ
jgi:hypothetical protein